MIIVIKYDPTKICIKINEKKFVCESEPKEFQKPGAREGANQKGPALQNNAATGTLTSLKLPKHLRASLMIKPIATEFLLENI